MIPSALLYTFWEPKMCGSAAQKVSEWGARAQWLSGGPPFLGAPLVEGGDPQPSLSRDPQILTTALLEAVTHDCFHPLIMFSVVYCMIDPIVISARMIKLRNIVL